MAKLYSFNFIFLVFISLIGCGGGGGGSSSCDAIKIAGGTLCKVENSAVVQIVSKKFQGITGCSGTVVAPNIVLTAGHCVIGGGETTIIASDGTSTLVEEAYYHRGTFAPTTAFDLGFYVIPPSFTSTAKITPIPIAKGTNEAIDQTTNVIISVFGYGQNEHGVGSGRYPKVANMTVSNVYRFNDSGTTFEFDAFNNSTDNEGGISCPGDSGGPAILNNYYDVPAIVGVVSRGAVTAQCYSQAGGTRFAGVDCEFIDVLSRHTNQLSTTGECI